MYIEHRKCIQPTLPYTTGDRCRCMHQGGKLFSSSDMLCYAVLQHLLEWGQGGDWHGNMRGLPQPAQVSDMSVSVGVISRQLFEAVQGICLTYQAAQGTWVMHPNPVAVWCTCTVDAPAAWM